MIKFSMWVSSAPSKSKDYRYVIQLSLKSTKFLKAFAEVYWSPIRFFNSFFIYSSLTYNWLGANKVVFWRTLLILESGVLSIDCCLLDYMFYNIYKSLSFLSLFFYRFYLISFWKRARFKFSGNLNFFSVFRYCQMLFMLKSSESYSSGKQMAQVYKDLKKSQ